MQGKEGKFGTIVFQFSDCQETIALFIKHLTKMCRNIIDMGEEISEGIKNVLENP